MKPLCPSGACSSTQPARVLAPLIKLFWPLVPRFLELSVAFIKDVAPSPQGFSLKWLGISWASFTIGLLAIVLSFLFSHRACLGRIDEAAQLLLDPKAETPRNPWAQWTDRCNFLCVFFLFLGVATWSAFALENLAWPKEKNDKPTNVDVRLSQEGLRTAESSSSAATANQQTNQSANAPATTNQKVR